jgi:hypothetical protein
MRGSVLGRGGGIDRGGKDERMEGVDECEVPLPVVNLPDIGLGRELVGGEALVLPRFQTFLG